MALKDVTQTNIQKTLGLLLKTDVGRRLPLQSSNTHLYHNFYNKYHQNKQKHRYLYVRTYFYRKSQPSPQIQSSDMRALKTITTSTLFLPIQRCFFCKVKSRHISDYAQRAVWACKIIQAIKASQPSNDIFAPSLRDILLDLPDPSPQYDFNQTIKKQMLNYFTEGVRLPLNAFCSSSIFRARQDLSSPISDLRVAFCPNYLVTQPIFQALDQYQFLFLNGGYGISKTFSLVLYSQLHAPINKFYFRARTQTHKFIQQELKQLSDEGLLKNYCKIWYWRVNWSQIKLYGWTSIRDSLISQAYELPEKDITALMNIDNLKEFIITLRKLYSAKGITSWIICDEIDSIITFMKKWNDFVLQKGDKLQNMKTSYLSQQEEMDLKIYAQIAKTENYYPAVQLFELYDTVKKLGIGFALNSSIDIEQSIIQDPDNSGQFPATHTGCRKMRTLMFPLLKKNEEAYSKKNNYCQRLKLDFAKADFWHFFWFELERNLLQMKVPKEKLIVAKRIFLLAANKQQIKDFYAHKDVLGCLRKKSIESELSKMIEELPTQEAILKTLGSDLQAFFTLEDLKKMFPFKQIQDKNDDQKTKTKQRHPLEAYFSQYLRSFSHFALYK